MCVFASVHVHIHSGNCRDKHTAFDPLELEP